MSQLLLDPAEPTAYDADALESTLPSVASPELHVAAPHDGLAVGMAYLLALSVLQRGMGLLRNVLFCRWLTPEELGRWNLAFSFLMVAAPLVVWGLPGVFGRYAEHYRARGHLRTFLRRMGIASAALTLLACAALAAAPATFAELVFRDASQTRLMLLAALALVAVIAFNFCTELFTALRRARIASRMQFAHSVLFTIAGFTLLATVSQGAGSVVLAYGIACAGACLVACFALRETVASAPAADATLSQRDFWTKMLPFAGWVWATSLLANLSDVADRYLILYFASGDSDAASALVGQYHSSRIAPDLLASVATMLAAVMLPYNTHDWEAGNRQAVSLRVRLALKLLALAMTAAGAALLLLAEPLFGWVLEGKYGAGEAILPWTLLLCIYFGLTILALNYLWCAERAGQAMSVMGLALAVNVLLNLALLPHWGLKGAVMATAAANGVSLIVALRFNRRLGMARDGGVAAACLAPLSLLLGAIPAAIAVLAICVYAAVTHRFLDPEEREQIAHAWKSIRLRRA